MSKYIMLGVNSNKHTCCMLHSDISFDQILSLIGQDIPISAIKLQHSATNWNGQDAIERTLELKALTPTKRKIIYDMTIHGTDPDMGRSYPWTFTCDEIWEVR